MTCRHVVDWEVEHEKFAHLFGNANRAPPDADELPRFWEAPDDLPLIWSQDILNAPEDENEKTVCLRCY